MMINESDVMPQLDYGLVFDFEKAFTAEHKQKWMAHRWHWALYISICYVLVAHVGQLLMKSRPPFDVQIPLTLWNVGYSVFNFLGTFRLFPEFYFVLTQLGYKDSVCNDSFIFSEVASFWTWAMVCSKVLELGDTAFIVLKKKSLDPMHWIHHATALILAWYGYGHRIACGRWAAFTNFATHSTLYSYLALRTLKIPLPKWASMLTLSLEITQLLLVLVALCRLTVAYMLEEPCNISFWALTLGLMIYSVDLILFSNYFYAMFWPKPKRKQALKSE